MKQKIGLLIGLFISLIVVVSAQNVSIKGTITTTDGKPATNIAISIEHTGKGDISNEKGIYNIKNIKPGSYVLKVSAIGIAAQEKTIALNAGQTLVENFVINLTSQELADVIVSATRNKFASEGSDDVAKMPLKNIENPQVYSIYNRYQRLEYLCKSYVLTGGLLSSVQF